MMQGISTSPATGSQTRPSWLEIAMAQASAHWAGVPPISSVSAAAAMAAAVPHSAWQPPWAPAMLARFAAAMPKAPAVNMAITASLSGTFPSSRRVRMHPGRMPQLPAVGAATIRPMDALHPATDRALAIALPRKGPHRPPFFSRTYSCIRKPSPPVSPDMDFWSFFAPAFADSHITCRSISIFSYSSSCVVSIASAWSSSTSSEIFMPRASAASVSSLTDSYFSICLSPSGHSLLTRIALVTCSISMIFCIRSSGGRLSTSIIMMELPPLDSRERKKLEIFRSAYCQ